MNADKDKRRVKDFLYEDLTYRIRGALYKVHKILGSGHKEGVYHLLVNFGAKSLDIRRRVYDKARIGADQR